VKITIKQLKQLIKEQVEEDLPKGPPANDDHQEQERLRSIANSPEKTGTFNEPSLEKLLDRLIHYCTMSAYDEIEAARKDRYATPTAKNHRVVELKDKILAKYEK